mmetsp:Transcript_820/g.1788  ORF Transcript_820/g.1788 Transcript_820/m.1788 type:complete len:213 (+) Transcript_820:1114-1752(+)
MSRQKLPLPRRLRRPWLLQCRNFPSPPRVEGTISRPHHPHPWQPREPTDHPGLRLLRRVPPQVWQRQRLEVLHRNLRLPFPLGHHRGQDIYRPRRAQSQHQHFGSDTRYRPQAGGSPRWRHVRSHVVRSRGDRWVGPQSTWGRVPVWWRRRSHVQRKERPGPHREGAPAGHGGTQEHVRGRVGDGVECSKLLLPVWQRGEHTGAGRALGKEL